ncbi:hypothetical protein [Candidatus Amarobacter glycogenicus]|uniref:hypothetical protein n=1 Tax=Candidatus Amarobacter glycogenicus TaxID=3140699 RepID=UPI002A0BAFD4|nr:hypothetical protein [Dehalococcoidia bacterium]
MERAGDEMDAGLADDAPAELNIIYSDLYMHQYGRYLRPGSASHTPGASQSL